jgi:hypothetical protein
MKFTRPELEKYLDRKEDSKKFSVFCLDSYDDGMCEFAETPWQFVSDCREVFEEIKRTPCFLTRGGK